MRRRGRGAFLAAACLALAAAVVALAAGRLGRGAGGEPSWGQLPAPAALSGRFGLAPCALGRQVPPRLVPVAAWSGADEEWCSKAGLQVVAFDGPGLPLWAQGLSAYGDGLLEGDVGGRRVLGAFWREGGGWVAVVAWGDPGAPKGLAGALGGLRRAALEAGG